MRRDLYAEVSARIVAELERGAAPWIKPWSVTAGANTPCNAVTNRPYSGCNVILLWLWRVPPLYPLTRAHEVDSATRWGRHLAAAADSILVLHRALPDLQRMKLC